MKALPADTLAPINVDLAGAMTVLIPSFSRIASLRGQIVEVIPRFDVKTFDLLPELFFALLRAQSKYGAYVVDDPLSALYDDALVLRSTLIGDARALAKRGLVRPESIAELRGIVGFKNVALDLLSLSEMITPHRVTAAAVTGVSGAEVDRAVDVAYELLGAVGARERRSEPGSAGDMRQRAYTLFVRAYDEARAAIAYVRREEGDADAFAPSLFQHRSRRSTDAPPADGSGTSAPTGSPSTPATPTTSSTSSTTVTSPSVTPPVATDSSSSASAEHARLSAPTRADAAE